MPKRDWQTIRIEFQVSNEYLRTGKPEEIMEDIETAAVIDSQRQVLRTLMKMGRIKKPWEPIVIEGGKNDVRRS